MDSESRIFKSCYTEQGESAYLLAAWKENCHRTRFWPLNAQKANLSTVMHYLFSRVLPQGTMNRTGWGLIVENAGVTVLSGSAAQLIRCVSREGWVHSNAGRSRHACLELLDFEITTLDIITSGILKYPRCGGPRKAILPSPAFDPWFCFLRHSRRV